MKQYKFITVEEFNEMLADVVWLGMEEINDRLFETWENKVTGQKYAVPKIRSVHMGFNSNEPGTVEKFVEIVEREGACKAAWGVTGRTMHQILAFQLAKQLPQYKFEIGYNYQCLARKVSD